MVQEIRTMMFVSKLKTRGALRTVLSVAAAATTLAVLTACSGTSSSGGNLTTKQAAEQLQKILSITPGASSGQGVTFNLGASYPLSGGGASDGVELTNAVNMAVEQVLAAGGPTIKVTYADNKSGDPAASKDSMRQLIAAGVPAKLSSYSDGLGAMLEDTVKSKMLSLDGVAGAAIFAQGVPYFYGSRASAPLDVLPGALKYWAQVHPDKKKVGLLGWDLGPLNAVIQATVFKMIADAGLEFNGLWETVPITSNDYAASIAKIKANEPDLLIMGMANQAPAVYSVQAKSAGVKATALGIEFTQTAVAASKGVWSQDGFLFSMDYFDATNPVNPLAKTFVDSYKTKYGTLPGFYAANAYEDVLAFWQLIRGAIAKGANPNNSDALLAALEANPTFPSVYGGDSKAPGVLGIDLKTHTVSQRPMGLYLYKGDTVTTLATFGVNGSDFTIIKK